MRRVLLPLSACLLLLCTTACNSKGACVRTETDRESCVDIPKNSCVEGGTKDKGGETSFKQGKTCESLGFTECDANGCRKP